MIKCEKMQWANTKFTLHTCLHAQLLVRGGMATVVGRDSFRRLREAKKGATAQLKEKSANINIIWFN